MMSNEKRLTVGITLTPDPSLLPVVGAFLMRMAAQAGFEEKDQLNLRQGFEQVCRRLMAASPGADSGEIRLRFDDFSDRLEITLEGRAGDPEGAEADSYLVNQLLDRVVVEELGEGRLHMTLVKNLSSVGRQP